MPAMTFAKRRSSDLSASLQIEGDSEIVKAEIERFYRRMESSPQLQATAASTPGTERAAQRAAAEKPSAMMTIIYSIAAHTHFSNLLSNSSMYMRNYTSVSQPQYKFVGCLQ